ncbi:AraC family transcriptional regulator [Vibrio sp. RC27]
MSYNQYSKPLLYPAPSPIENITLSTETSGHAHDYLQVVIGLQGKADFDISGSGNKIIPGQGCIITPDSRHAFSSIDEPSEILVLNLASNLEGNESAMSQMQELALSDCYFGLSATTTQLIRMLATEVRSCPDDASLCQACNYTVVALLKKHARAFHTHSQRLNMDIIDCFIHSNIQNKISVSQMAGSVFLSESQFHNLFKKQTGVTPHQYVLTKRVEYAKQLIENKNVKLSQISDMAGFSGQSAFTHAFSKYEGISPSHYKTRYWS